ncbi:alcohol dehydrogenase catalytic domain-containing protein [Ruicaihuangia caeni]|uniref:alcohol dehydrogenase catalytic domain-containing protein n=1 Tax=Ruicaihuangia caeni TaxID=3042517 RepID=UPI00338F299A
MHLNHESPADLSVHPLRNSEDGQPATATSGARRPPSATSTFRAFVRQGDQAGVQTVKQLPIRPNEVVIKLTTTSMCYTTSKRVLAPRDFAEAEIPGHVGVGIVEEIGSEVRRCKVGDRVLGNGTPQCGTCYNCVRGRAEWCEMLPMALGARLPIAELSDGTPVYSEAGLGGTAEKMILHEDYVQPLHTSLSDSDVILVADTAGLGFAAADKPHRVQIGDNVVVLGAGPVGLGAIQSARASGAGQIISVEPIAYRKELALKAGAHVVLDPNTYARGDGGMRGMPSDELVNAIKELCKGPNDDRRSGGRDWGPLTALNRGADVVIEAVGGDVVAPDTVTGPDPTGILPLRQAWEMCRAGGHVITLGINQQGDVSFPATAFAILGRTVHAAQAGGVNILQDMYRYHTVAERGVFDLSILEPTVFTLDQVPDAARTALSRRVISVTLAL